MTATSIVQLGGGAEARINLSATLEQDRIPPWIGVPAGVAAWAATEFSKSAVDAFKAARDFCMVNPEICEQLPAGG